MNAAARKKESSAECQKDLESSAECGKGLESS
eukprot:CAMPEP_0119408396 /NCGR_PEP_ID=MMETSP1335-20130426/1955_1 /TAXON_ID=259385 /ORGANISM="Chrysoculter rhomboideus, Strain RCC1486" /LENGTH=31 /DNA_ID= /DNA_START= /DNA_END= /DNA_ORIENTATION=